MSLVTVLNLSLSFVGREILKEVNFQVAPGDRIGLVGPNGSGKTSLLRMIVGELHPDKGEIRIAKGARVGYLPQDVYEVLSGGLLEFVMDSVPSRVHLKEQQAALESSLGDHPDPQTQSKLAAQLAEVHHKIIDLDAQYPLHLAEKILLGLGFKPEEFERPMSSLSGGWKMRAALASLLYQSPDLLLLDEPTNHLDVPSVHWIEDFLRTYKGAMVLICHDREFLNRQSERTISFEPEGMRFYNGNYEHYLKAREEESKVLESRANIKAKVKEAEQFINSSRPSFKAKLARATACEKDRASGNLSKAQDHPLLLPRGAKKRKGGAFDSGPHQELWTPNPLQGSQFEGDARGEGRHHRPQRGRKDDPSSPDCRRDSAGSR
jgi:ATP-binding cassette subfamily F protein 3